MRKIVAGTAGAAVVLTLGIGLRPIVAQAAKVDCSKVMSELNNGKKPADVADDLGISTSSVYRCRRRSRKTAKTTAAAGSPIASSSPAAPGSPMASPSPAQGGPSSH
jgi:hypothetical protein